jgi:hypothetical protein
MARKVKDGLWCFFVAVSLAAVLLAVEAADVGNEQEGDVMIGQVYAAMQKEQVQRSQPFRPFPMQWREDRGLYRSSIHLDFVGQGTHPSLFLPVTLSLRHTRRQ